MERPDNVMGAFASLNLLLAVLLVAGFAYLVVRPDSQPVTDNIQERFLFSYPAELFKDSLWTTVMTMEPTKLLKLGRKDDAYNAAQDLNKADDRNVENLLCSGIVFLASDDKALQAKGASNLVRAVDLCPESKYVRIAQARAFAAAHNLPEAEASYDRVIAAAPDWATPGLEEAVVFMSAQDFDKALKRAKRVKDLESDNIEAARLVFLIEADQANLAKSDPQLKQAFDSYIASFEEERQQKAPAAAQAVVDKNGGDIDKAIAETKQQLTEKKDDLDLKLMLAHLYLFKSQWQDAKDVLLDAKKQANHNPQVLRLMAATLAGLNDKEGAFSEFKSAAGLDVESSTTSK